MTCLVLSRVGVIAFSVAAFGGGCASSASPSAEAVSAAPVSPAPPIASERTPSAGLPTQQVPAAVGGANVATPPPAEHHPGLTPASASYATDTGPAPTYSGADPCHLAIKSDSPVAKACREGGVKAAKVAMKDLVKGARAAGVRFQCDDCHSSDSDYTQLAKGSEEKFAKLLAANRR
jgi:hypothetical protein